MVLLLSIIVLTSNYILYTKWQHQTPAIQETELMDGLFKLKTISVYNSYRKELLFTIELSQYIPQDDVCNIASKMGKTLFNTYPFDKKYHKIADIIFSPEQKEENSSPYPLGQVVQYKEDGEHHIGCYLKYK